MFILLKPQFFCLCFLNLSNKVGGSDDGSEIILLVEIVKMLLF